MRFRRKSLGIALGAVVFTVSPLAAMPQFCPSAKPGCAGTCHTDANLAKCPKNAGQKPPSNGQKPSSKLLEDVSKL